MGTGSVHGGTSTTVDYAPGARSRSRPPCRWSSDRRAAIAFYGVNEKIAPLLHLKALSWSRPAQWIDEQVVAAGITLSEMNKLMIQILERGEVST